MRKFIQNKLKEQKGLTLIELLAVIVILAIIAAIAIPAIGNIIENSRYGAAKADFQNALAAANLYVIEEGTVPGTVGVLDDYLKDQGSLADDVAISGTTSGNLSIGGSFKFGSGTKTLPVTSSAVLNDMSTAAFKSAVNGTTITTP